MNILLFRNFKKRVNSTLRPADSLGESRTISAKSRIDYLNPVFLITGIDMSINYVKWQGAYYYVTDKAVRLNDIMELTCSIDAPATIKEDIMATTAHVVYSSSDYTKHLRDQRLQPTLTVNNAVGSVPLSTLFFDASGCYVIGVISKEASGVNGALDYFVLTIQELKALISRLLEKSFFEQISDLLVNPMDFIVSCKWLPFSSSDMPGIANQPIFIREVDTNLTGRRLSAYTKNNSVAVAFPYPQGHESTFLDLSPFTTASIYLPFVGIVDLPTDALYPSTTCNIDINVDIILGNISYKIGRSATVGYYSIYSGSCSANLPLSNAKQDVENIAGGTFALIGTAISAAVVPMTAPVALGIAGAALAGAGTTISGTSMHTQTNGALSSRLGATLGLDIVVTFIMYVPSEFFDSEERIARIGLPCNKMRTLTGLTGYCQTSGASISTSAPDSVRNTCNAMLDSGIYLE